MVTAETAVRLRVLDEASGGDELAELEALVEDVLRRWDAAAAPHLSGAEAVWHRQELAATRRRLSEALEQARLAAGALEAEAATATALGRTLRQGGTD